jgi:HEAT repeat protein
LRKSDEVEVAATTSTLANGKAEALPVCTWLLRRAPEPQVRSRVVNVLDKMGPAGGPAGKDLVAALDDPDPLVRAGAARVIGNLAPNVPGAVAALIKLFPEREAIRAVAEFRAAGAAAAPALTALTRHPDAAVRRNAVRTLGRIGQAALPALPDLMTLTTGDPEAGVREQSAEAIGELGAAAAAGIPSLVTALRDGDAKVRRDAVRSLGQMGPTARKVLDSVAALAADPDENVRKAAVDAARKIHPGGKP